ncbi:MAG: efflux RND transporter permease subunit [Bacteroidales bacterium]|nr:efflux RND transporter permease subunit [Bacteroidales bacterium]
MSIYKTAIEKPVTTSLIFVAIIVMGLFALIKLPIDQLPEIEPPFVSIMTAYPGNNGSEIETNVTKVLENSLNSIEGLDEMTSQSKDNISLVSMKFNWGYDIDEAVNDIRSQIDLIYENLPDGCSRPAVFKFNTSMMPILMYAVTAEESYPGLEKILTDNVINVLNRVDGIGNLSISGAPERFVYVDVDQSKLDAYGLTLETVSNAVSGNNLNLASGTMKVGKEQYQLRVKSEYEESAEINNIVVSTTRDGKKIFVKDVANVRDTIKDLFLDEKINGSEGCRLIIMKQTGANTVQIVKDVKAMMEEIQKNLPPDIKFEIINDSSLEIINAVNGLSESIMYALIFVVLVVLFFLGQWRAALIVGICIPISLIVSFLYLLATGSSLNIISLSSLTVAIGMVVDDAIVVLENIDKHLQRGASPREAAIYATNEVWVSVIATTLVTCAVFIPLTMLSGMAGILFKELGWIVTITVCTSTTVAISLTPMMCSKMLKARDLVLEKLGVAGHEKKEGFINRLYKNTIIKGLNWLDQKYSDMLRVCLNHKALTVTAIVVFFGLSLVPAILGYIGTDFMPQTDNGRLQISIELQGGTRVEESAAIMRKVEAEMAARNPEIRIMSTTIGSNDDAGISALFSSTTNNKVSMYIRTTQRQDRPGVSLDDIKKRIREQLDQVPEIKVYIVSQGQGGMANNSVDVEIYGYDFQATNRVAEDVKRICREMPGTADVNVSRQDDRAELQVVFDKEKLSAHGLSTSAAGMLVRNRINGATAGYLKEDGEEYDIRVRLTENYRNSISAIEELTIPTSTGLVKLKELGKVEEYWCPPTIDRKSRERITTVKVTPVEMSLSELAEAVQAELDGLQVPEGVKILIGGDYKEQQESFADMALLFALIVMLVYIVMASQFESLMKPFIIMMSMPFAISGVIFALWFTNTSLNMIGALGVILLVGIVTKNGIVLVDYINLMRDRGLDLTEAIALSGKSRLRPVLMTAFTTILGMIPMALSTSEGSEMWVPMGVVVIGGLLVSTVVTLFIVPVLYALFSKKGERDNQAELRKQFVFFDMADDIVFDSRKLNAEEE